MKIWKHPYINLIQTPLISKANRKTQHPWGPKFTHEVSLTLSYSIFHPPYHQGPNLVKNHHIYYTVQQSRRLLHPNGDQFSVSGIFAEECRWVLRVPGRKLLISDDTWKPQQGGGAEERATVRHRPRLSEEQGEPIGVKAWEYLCVCTTNAQTNTHQWPCVWLCMHIYTSISIACIHRHHWPGYLSWDEWTVTSRTCTLGSPRPSRHLPLSPSSPLLLHKSTLFSSPPLFATCSHYILLCSSGIPASFLPSFHPSISEGIPGDDRGYSFHQGSMHPRFCPDSPQTAINSVGGRLFRHVTHYWSTFSWRQQNMQLAHHFLFIILRGLDPIVVFSTLGVLDLACVKEA